MHCNVQIGRDSLGNCITKAETELTSRWVGISVRVPFPWTSRKRTRSFDSLPKPKMHSSHVNFFFCFYIFASVYKMMMDDCFGVFRTTEEGHFPGLSTLFSSFFDLRVLLEDDLWHAWPRGFSGGVRGAFTSLWTCDRKWRMKNCYFCARANRFSATGKSFAGAIVLRNN